MVTDNGYTFPCWFCGHETADTDLVRLDAVVSLSGYVPGPCVPGKGFMRVCRDDLVQWTRWRQMFESEQNRLPKAA